MAKSASDIATGNWVDRYLPGGLRPYARLARLDRPIGTWLLLIPCWWGLALATGFKGAALQSAAVPFVLFALGAGIMRAAGCVWNDITDRDFDGKVARTATRPIPSGDVTVTQAALFMGALCLAGLMILLTFDKITVVIGISSLALVAAYPFMKRITYWPQAWLGLTFNWGVLVGWSSVMHGLDLSALLLYAAGPFWTLGYDTIYAHCDRADDLMIGIKSTALKFGAKTARWLMLFYTVTIALIGAAAWTAHTGPWFWPFLAVAAGHLVWQIRSLDINDPAVCIRLFRSNRDFGLIVLAGMIAGAL